MILVAFFLMDPPLPDLDFNWPNSSGRAQITQTVRGTVTSRGTIKFPHGRELIFWPVYFSRDKRLFPKIKASLESIVLPNNWTEVSTSGKVSWVNESEGFVIERATRDGLFIPYTTDDALLTVMARLAQRERRGLWADPALRARYRPPAFNESAPFAFMAVMTANQFKLGF
jgi:hypothetical protein